MYRVATTSVFTATSFNYTSALLAGLLLKQAQAQKSSCHAFHGLSMPTSRPGHVARRLRG